MLDDGADPNATVNSEYHGKINVLICAAGIQFVEGVKLLLEAGADVNFSSSAGKGAGGGKTALHSAINGDDTRPGTDTKHSTEEDRLKIVDMLLNTGADPNAISQGTNQPLADAAHSGYFDVCQRLIQAGATFKDCPLECGPPLSGTAAGASPFNPSVELKLERVAKWLLDLGAPVDGRAVDGSTALMTAAYRSSKRLVELFLKYGANVNQRDDDGRTALIRVGESVRRNSALEKHQFAFEVAKLLIEAGADPNIRNNKGETAYEIASRSQVSSLVVDYLRELTNDRA